MQERLLCRDCGVTDFLGVECAWPSGACLGSSPLQRRRRHSALTRLAALLALALLATAAWHLGKGGYMLGKAWAAQSMIAQAWTRTIGGEARARPWPWADTWPVARLRAPLQDSESYVLAGASGRSMAFGPGHMFGTAAPGAAGNSVIGAHRDTHFAFLQRLRVGDPIEVETARGERVNYRVSETRVVDKSATGLLAQDPELRELTLVTCYPFDAVRPGGPLRYVVRARAEPAPGEPPADRRITPRSA